MSGCGNAGDHRAASGVGQGVVLDHRGECLVLDDELWPRRAGLGGMPLSGGSRVALHLGVDSRCLRPVGVDGARGGQRGYDPPAQVGVDG
ncbi:Uncharacterised protein [Mycobacterium tuberculosis]|nr:Uncharacterised protein [Mycobacterium tuberculosis]